MSQTSAADTRAVLVYDGTIAELFGIFLLNLLLTIITLGIYRFWAITRIRRYLWSHMRFVDTRLTYTGRGKELFLGFLLAMLILSLIAAAVGLASFGLARIHPGLAAIPIGIAYIGLFILFGAAHFTAQRYRLSRTEWRGIRGGMQGSALRYGLAWLLYVLSVIVTLYQSVPWMQVGLARRRINATRFGSASFHFEGRARHIYLSWLLATLGNLVVLGLIVGIVAVLEWSTLEPVVSGRVTGPAAEIAMHRAVPIFIAAMIVFSVASGLLVTWYAARLVRLIMGGTTMAIPGPRGDSTVTFSSTVTAGRLLWLIVSNFLIALVTLGLGVPIVLHRTARYMAETTRMTGAIDANALVQSTLARPSVGEGFLQALDPGIV